MTDNVNKLNASIALSKHIGQLLKNDKRPNILLLMTDQQRHDTIKASGYPHMKTPNLDRLAREGCTFVSAYSPNPICCPARHNLITGLSSKYHGISDNDFEARCLGELPTIAQILSDNGYDTRAIGKMHFQPVRRHNGFLKMELMEEVPQYADEDEYTLYLKDQGLGNIQNIHGVRNLLYMVPQRSIIPDEHHGTKWVADRSIDYLKTRSRKRPFFLFSSWIAPHPPFDVPDTFADLYKNEKIPTPAESKTPISHIALESILLADHPTKEYGKRMRELYYAAISHVDEHIGRMIDTLEELGQLDDTVILFTSDHGEMLGDHGIYQKWLPYDACSRIPLIIRYPKIFKGGTVRTEFTDLNDIMPTVLHAAGLNYPGKEKLPGGSLFMNDGSKSRQYQYIEYSKGNRRWISLRDKRFKYNYYYGGGLEELFDMVDDPNESVDLLYGEPNSNILEIRCKLRSELIRYEKEFGLPGYVIDDELIRMEPYKPNPYRNSAFPVFPLTINEDERIKMNDFYDEVIMAVEKEEVVKLDELDLDTWKKQPRIPSGNISKVLGIPETKQHIYEDKPDGSELL